MNLINELIARATERYPIGTVFTSLGGNKGVIVDNGDYFYRRNKHSDLISLFTPNGAYKGWVVNPSETNKWAEITKHATPQIINTYDIW